MITDRGVPVAVLVPVEEHGSPESAGGARLARLERAGLVQRRTAPIEPAVLREAPPAARKGGSAVAALLAARAEGR